MQPAQDSRAASGPATGVAHEAPAVVAVVVASDPGDWLDEALGSLAAQDYPNFSVLVADVGVGHGPAGPALAERVAAVLPEAHLARLAPGTGFAQAANQALEMVRGASHVLLCHDDVAFEPSALRLLVEEAYRSNAGLVCPKVVMWDAPDRLLSVGMGADRLGVVHQLVQRGELDQGQHDGVREVFVAPSGATLVRRDLWLALGGFDPKAAEPGEDLDLCWRAQVAGARVGHLEASWRGLRPAPRAGGGGTVRHRRLGPLAGRRQREQHRLRTLWTCYSARALVLVAPVVLAFALAEATWALLGRGWGRAALDQGRGLERAAWRCRAAWAPLAALAGSLRAPRELRAARRRAQGLRQASDLDLWRSQRRGSARLRAVLRLRLEHDPGRSLPSWATSGQGRSPRHHDVAHQRHLGRLPASNGHGPAEAAAPASLASRAGYLDWRVGAGVAAVLATLLLVGSRNLLSGPLPLVGQLPSSVGGVGGWWHGWWAGTGPDALVATAVGPPALAFMALLGTLLGGSASLAVHVLVLAPLVTGPLGTYVVARGFGSRRGALAATVVYTVVPVPYNALAQGHWPGLVAYGAVPWILGGLVALSGQEPQPALPGRAAVARLVALGLVVAVAVAFVPSMVALVPVLGLALWAGSRLAGRGHPGARFFLVAVAATAIAWVALLPWSARLLGPWPAFAGTGGGPGTSLGVGQVLRLQSGPFGAGLLAWAVVVAAGLPLALGRSWRLAWAVRLWSVALAGMGLAWAGSRGWLPAPAPEVLLAPAAAALALAVGVGGAAVESDLPAYRFGWRQLVPALGALAVLAAALPLFSWSASGQWGLPASGAEAAFAFPPPASGGAGPGAPAGSLGAPNGYYRALWVGPPALLPMAPQGRLGAVLAFATSSDGLPAAAGLWPPGAGGEALVLARDLDWAAQGATTSLGRLLAPLAVRYVVVPAGPATGAVEAALGAQTDLVPVGTDPAYHVFQNSDWAPWLWVAPGRSPGALAARSQTWAGASQLERLGLSGVVPLVASRARLLAPLGRLPAGSGRPVALGPVTGTPDSLEAGLDLPSGGMLYAASPVGTLQLRVNGHRVPARAGFGWASAWRLPAGRDALQLRATGTTGRHLVGTVMAVAWVLAVWALVSRAGRRLHPHLHREAVDLAPGGGPGGGLDWAAGWDEEVEL